MTRHFWALWLVASLWTPASNAENGAFYLDELPRGRSITLPHPATTFASLSSRVKLTSTDLPQTVSLLAVSRDGQPVSGFKVAIFDSHSDRVQYIKVNSRAPVLYVFKALQAIQVVPQPRDPKVRNSAYLKLESNRPLGIAH